MPFALSLIVSGTTYSLSDGNPYKLQDAVGLGLPPVQRFSSRYPRQDGYDDSGFVLEPRVITLALSFVAATAAALDGHRDTLSRMFSPATSAVLQVARDDGEVRRIDVVATAAPVITLVPEHRPGNLHRAVVQLRAADPIWYNPTPGTVTLTALTPSDWWSANNLIDEEVVLEHVDGPSAGQSWVFGTPISYPGFVFKHTIAYYGYAGGSGVRMAWYTEYPPAPGFGTIPQRLHSFYRTDGTSSVVAVFPGNIPTTDSDPLWVYSTGAALGEIGTAEPFSLITTVDMTRITAYLNGTSVFSLDTLAPSYPPNVARSFWRPGTAQTGGTTAIPFGSVIHAATYNVLLTPTEIANLHQNMTGTIASYTLMGTVPYVGSYDEYPTITMAGPLGDPVLTNVTTGQKLDFTGSTIPAGVTYTIDLSRDVLIVTDQGGTIHTNKLTEDSDLGGWNLAPSGDNVVFITATSTGTASQAQLVYRNRYVSY